MFGEMNRIGWAVAWIYFCVILFFWFPVTAGVLFWVGLYIIGGEL